MTYMNHCKSLKFEENPEYGFLRKQMRNALKREGIFESAPFDWEISVNNETFKP